MFASRGRENHPVKRSLTPLRRRGIVCLHRRGIPPRQAELDTPPKEGNDSPSPVTVLFQQTRHNHPVKRSLTPLHRRGIVCLHRREIICLQRRGKPPRQAPACHPSRGGELLGQTYITADFKYNKIKNPLVAHIDSIFEETVRKTLLPRHENQPSPSNKPFLTRSRVMLAGNGTDRTNNTMSVS